MTHWRASDGYLPGHRGIGGLAERIQGSRNLKLLGEKAVWTLGGVKDWSCKALAPLSKGLVLLWDIETQGVKGC